MSTSQAESPITSRSEPPPVGAIEDARAEPLGLYLHIPFCARKCPYCDFNTYAGLDDMHEAFVAALIREIEALATRASGRRLHSVFLGGGTPTALGPEQLDRILQAVSGAFRLEEACELTSEANPGSADRSRFKALRAAGVNRLSMGVQSFQDTELRFLGRIHDAAEALRAFETAREAGFENISLDFMFGLPEQRMADWDASLTRALELAPEHLSLYSLIVEQGTPLYEQVARGRVPAPSEDASAGFYERARERLAEQGYLHYEVSNWARKHPADAPDGFEAPVLASRHNLIYWRNGDFLCAGPGAHGSLHRHGAADAPGADEGGGSDHRHVLRWSNLRSVPAYIRRIQAGESAEAEREEVRGESAMAETMMLSLRLLREGLEEQRFAKLHGRSVDAAFGARLRQLEDWGLVQRHPGRVRLSERGLMVANQVFERFFPEELG